MRVYFIAHGNEKIGMGHVIRTLTLATAFRDSGHTVSFFSKYILGIEIIKKWGFSVYTMPEQRKENFVEGFFYGNLEELEEDTQYVCKKVEQKADIIVIDSYNVNHNFFESIKKKTACLVYIDDVNAFPYPVDVLVNGSASAFSMGYKKKQSAQLLLGLRYNLIRKEFCNLPLRKANFEVENVLITTGNSDPADMTKKFLGILKEENFKNLKIHVIVGSGFRADELKDFCVLNGLSVFLYNQPDKISEIMLRCDLAIAAGGSTLYELAACGVPAAVFAYADNQIPQIMAMEKKDLIEFIGYFESINIEKLIKYIQSMQQQYEVRKELTRKLQALVDARGALRIVKVLENYHRIT